MVKNDKSWFEFKMVEDIIIWYDFGFVMVIVGKLLKFKDEGLFVFKYLILINSIIFVVFVVCVV